LHCTHIVAPICPTQCLRRRPRWQWPSVAETHVARFAIDTVAEGGSLERRPNTLCWHQPYLRGRGAEQKHLARRRWLKNLRDCDKRQRRSSVAAV